MFEKIKEFWDNKGFQILVGIFIAIIIIFGLYNIFSGKKGSWTKNYKNFFNDEMYIPKDDYIKRGPPKESNGEIECRQVLRKIFNKPFNKTRPNFLNNSVTGGDYNLELDCYDDELRLAIEYNGRQHYDYIPFFHKNKEAFYNQKYRDELKRRMCKDNNIILIEVPYTVKKENIESYLITKLKNLGFKSFF